MNIFESSFAIAKTFAFLQFIQVKFIKPQKTFKLIKCASDV